MSSAQDEFNSLFSNSEKLPQRHPEDSSPAISRGNSPVENTRTTSAPVNDYLTDDDDNTNHRQGGNNKKTSSLLASTDMRSRYFLPTTIRAEANTGPKGVIADACNFETAKRSARFSFFRSKSSNNNNGAVSSHPDSYGAPSSMLSSMTDNSSEEEEDEFMARWRQTRLAQLQRESNPSRSRTVSPSKRIWGKLVDVDAGGYLDAIEKVRADTIVVVLVYDDSVSSNHNPLHGNLSITVWM